MADSPLRRTCSSTQVLVQRSPVAGNIRLHTTSPSLKRNYSQAFHHTMGPPKRPLSSHVEVEHEEEHELASDDYNRRCPSPVPTEIIEDVVEEPPKDWVQECANEGIKVKDYAYSSGNPIIPIIWAKSLHSLALHDIHLRRRDFTDFYQLDGKTLYRLLSTDWVSQAEAERHWRPEDWERVNQYKQRPGGPDPFIMVPKRNRPTQAFRIAIRKDCFEHAEEELSDSEIWMEPDTPESWDGADNLTLLRDSKPDSDEHIDKKRRLDEDEADPDDYTYVSTPLITPENSITRSQSIARVASVRTPEPHDAPKFYSQPTHMTAPRSPRSPRAGSTPPRSPQKLERKPSLHQRRGAFGQRTLARSETILRF
ncbi:hypothetical protein QCA50_014722 [Cerrena zonata]|uniref:Uncharacterized protein n=1 Tax=Cerrena zonata TaxID=2478898 RepID=A0AAW0FMQ6_9APHY